MMNIEMNEKVNLFYNKLNIDLLSVFVVRKNLEKWINIFYYVNCLDFDFIF